MPQRKDIKKVLIIGSGPIVIGQACEFDYSGTQACQALKGLGYTVVLVNSNPATIMTDPEMAHTTYIEPLNKARLTEIIATERPCALLPNCGGQTALNLAMELEKEGVFAQYGVEVIGVNLGAIERGEDRIAFKAMMKELNIEMARSSPAYSVDEAVNIAKELGYPCVVRPAYTMGGAGGGICRTEEELRDIASRGINASMINQVLIEESVLGWEELELEIVRDSTDHCITICYIENVDPMGVHTGDSICCAPMLDVSEEVMARLEDAAHKIVRRVGVMGGCNCQFAYNPKDGRIVVIEINPRTSRSSALASKATGFPIARVSALLAAGLTLKELPYWRLGTLDKYKPYGDYVVVKFPRWAFEKFPGAQDALGTQMKAVGEVMSIGKNFKEALQKAVRSLEIGRAGIGFAKGFNSLSKEELFEKIKIPTSERLFVLYELLRKGVTVDELFKLTAIKPYFLNSLKELVELEEEVLKYRTKPLPNGKPVENPKAAPAGKTMPDDLLLQAKKDGFSDKYLAWLLYIPEIEISKQRETLGIKKGWEAIQVSGAENEFYYFSTYLADTPLPQPANDNKKKVMILGGGPNRIGQGIEFDYCCVHATYALRDMGYETVMVNCNPSTVSTDYDTADRLYFEPLTVEDVLEIVKYEKPMGVVVQFGGQTPLNIAQQLKALGVPILGTPPEIIATAEDRDLFRAMMEKLNIPMPESGMAKTVEEAVAVATGIGFPLIVRPSYVLGGAGMAIVYNMDTLKEYMKNAISKSDPEEEMAPILIDRFLERALECEADAISDGTNVSVPSIIEHIEHTGIHSGDSGCTIPHHSIPEAACATIYEYTRKIAHELGVIGLMNIQYAIEAKSGKVFIIEANPRASRTVPLVSKVCNIQMAKLATKVMIQAATGEGDLDLTTLKPAKVNFFGVKESVFPFNMFHEVDPVLGPEMRSTGEVLGMGGTFEEAFALAQEGAKCPLPKVGTVLISFSESYMRDLPGIARDLQRLGFGLVATESTHKELERAGIPARPICELLDMETVQPISDLIMDGTINMVVNTPGGSIHGMGPNIRRAAIRKSIPMYTTPEMVLSAINAISARSKQPPKVKSLQAYHAGAKN
ncbi:MAG: carbamoyl-phosphate synthase large subunit [Defluviitaleaceae bacterium]|nr:carbamoyl-phosphate synthase large subunit [Defluviitaleaceae bacterium]MCL2263651.1 carbamoyl-phosphate synthase large subunit [Defluviitaleaceae bacterium]MCL2263884.1 carbamoyl-phosphate synthase large subunit [Defluviitaleaceae bacterium]